MYRPKGKYKKPKKAAGNVVKKDGTPYQGSYIQLSNGTNLSGNRPSKASRVLRVVSDINETDSSSKIPVFKSQTVYPSEIDYDKGFFIRYFVQDIHSQKIIEVTKNNFSVFKNTPYTVQDEVKWQLTHPIEDVKKGPYIGFGSKTINKESVLNTKNIVNLDNFIKNYAQFIK